MIDTDVLIDFLRGVAKARDYVRSLQNRPFLSAVTVAELYAGVRQGDEQDHLDGLVGGFRVLPVSSRVAIAGGLYSRQYRRSHGTGTIDALIAATAKAEGCVLVTLNRKHFPMLSDLIVPYVKP